MTSTVIHGGEILDADGRRRLDITVDDESGLVIDLGPDLAAPAGGQMLDATGCIVTPGLVDLHCHLRQPGHEAAGTVQSGAAAAALGGYTAVVAMADTDPWADDAAVISEVRALAAGAPCDIVPAAALTIGGAGEVLSPYGELAGLGVRLFTDSARAVQSPTVLRRALEYLGGVAAATGVRLVAAQRLQTDALAGAGVMHEGAWSARLGLPGQPGLGEELMATQTIGLARLTGTPVHLQQVSTAAAVEAIRAAKADSVPVTAEVSPHHLVLDDGAVAGYDPNLKTEPPLRPRSDIEALVAAVADGTIDAIATDHHPHTMDAKERPFDQAPFGVLGLETALAVLLTETDLSLDRLVAAMSWQPAAIAGLTDHGGPVALDRPANLAVIDPEARWEVGVGSFGGYATNSPVLGRTLTAQVRHTIHRGRPVVVGSRLPVALVR